MNRTLNPDFVKSLASLGSAADGLAEDLTQGEPTIAVRVNNAKGGHIPADTERVIWSAEGFYLSERPLFVADPAWHQGLYYVQEASSMVSEAALRAILQRIGAERSPLRVLDACAAPGGKTIGILDALNADDFVVANELEPRRCAILAENIAKRGAANVAITRGAAQAFASMPNAFNIISADVPCSGEGMMRKDDTAVSQWSSGLVAQCSKLQREIIEALWIALRPGGYLIYSTCTFNRQENEENIEYLVDKFGAESIDLGLDTLPGVHPAIDSDIYAARFFPGKVRGEGLFISVLRKPEEVHTCSYPSAGKEDAASRNYLKSVLSEPEKYSAYIQNGVIEAIPRFHESFALHLRRKVRTIRSGLPIGELKGHDFVPTHELAMSTAMRGDAFPRITLSYAGAMSYLRGEAISELPDGTARGFVLPCFYGRPLGFAKSVGRRANNLYPNQQRLRLSLEAIPTEPPHIIEL